MRRALRPAGCFALLIAALAPVAPAAADEGGETLLADFIRLDDGVIQEARTDFRGGRIETGEDEQAIVRIGEQAAIHFRQNAKASLKIERSDQENQPKITVDVDEGGIWVSVARLLPDALNIFTFGREVKVGVKQTVLEVQVLGGDLDYPATVELGTLEAEFSEEIAEFSEEILPRDQTTVVRVLAGEATVEGGGRERRVPAGTETRVRRGKKPQLPRAISPFDPSILLLSSGAELEDPRLLDFIDPRIEPPKDGFP